MFIGITQAISSNIKRSIAFIPQRNGGITRLGKGILAKNIQYSRCFSAVDDKTSSSKESSLEDEGEASFKSPWNAENISPKTKARANKSRFRQHVNPLARKFQMPTDMISKEWPNDGTFTDPTLPLHIDIGCGKGGFLLSLAKERLEENGEENENRNYLGLEIRPSVAQFAKERVTRREFDGIIDFIGCNANVDLERMLDRYTSGGGEVALVSIQFPDPHFKKSHQKRRVVTPELVNILAKYILPGREIFIQSDIKDVLDNIRLTIREEGSEFFTDLLDDVDQYMENNPLGVPTEREVCVLDQNLPVFRTVFKRTDMKYNE